MFRLATAVSLFSALAAMNLFGTALAAAPGSMPTGEAGIIEIDSSTGQERPLGVSEPVWTLIRGYYLTRAQRANYLRFARHVETSYAEALPRRLSRQLALEINSARTCMSVLHLTGGLGHAQEIELATARVHDTDVHRSQFEADTDDIPDDTTHMQLRCG